MIMIKIYDPKINEMKNTHKFQLLFKLQILFQAYFKYHKMPQPRILQLPWICSSRWVLHSTCDRVSQEILTQHLQCSRWWRYAWMLVMLFFFKELQSVGTMLIPFIWQQARPNFTLSWRSWLHALLESLLLSYLAWVMLQTRPSFLA